MGINTAVTFIPPPPPPFPLPRSFLAPAPGPPSPLALRLPSPPSPRGVEIHRGAGNASLHKPLREPTIIFPKVNRVEAASAGVFTVGSPALRNGETISGVAA